MILSFIGLKDLLHGKSFILKVILFTKIMQIPHVRVWRSFHLWKEMCLVSLEFTKDYCIHLRLNSVL